MAFYASYAKFWLNVLTVGVTLTPFDFFVLGDVLIGGVLITSDLRWCANKSQIKNHWNFCNFFIIAAKL